MSESKLRRYGRWAGNERGVPENRDYCIVEVPAGADSFLYRQCSRLRGFGPESLYCKQHASMLGRGKRLHVPGGPA